MDELTNLDELLASAGGGEGSQSQDDNGLDDILGAMDGDINLDGDEAPSEGPAKGETEPEPQMQPSEPSVSRDPSGGMSPEAQALTYTMARQMQAEDAARKLRDGWSYASTEDVSKKESPALRPFDKLDYGAKKPYLDASANAVMLLLDKDFTLSVAAPGGQAIPPDVRLEAEAALMAAGRTREEAAAAIDAVSASGFTIGKAPSKGLRLMEAYFEMASQKSVSGAEEAETYILSTVNMARKKGYSFEDINVFIKEKNEMYGSRVAMLSADGEKNRLLESFKAEYESAYEEALRGFPTTPFSVPGTSRTVLGDYDFYNVYNAALEDARSRTVPRIEALPEQELRDALYAEMDRFERDEFFTRHRAEDSGIKGQWKEAMDEAVAASEALSRKNKEYSAAMQKWRGYKWYEKLFIPKPERPAEELKVLEQRRNEAVRKLSAAWRQDHPSFQVMGPEGRQSVVSTTVSLSQKGRPVLSLKERDAEGRETVLLTQLFMRDGSVRDVTNLDGASPEDRVRISKMNQVLRERNAALSEEVKVAATLAMAHRLSEARREELTSTAGLQEVRRERAQVRENGLTATEELRQRLDKEREFVRQRAETVRQEQETGPSLHPNLAGDITPKDVEILKAYRLNGGKGRDLQGIIDALKEKKEIVVTGTMTFQRTHSYDPVVLPVQTVCVGLRLGAGGSLIVFNPNNRKELGTVRNVLSQVPYDSAFIVNPREERARRRREAQEKRQQETPERKQPRPRRHGGE